jgi:hypothetical protein
MDKLRKVQRGEEEKIKEGGLAHVTKSKERREKGGRRRGICSFHK